MATNKEIIDISVRGAKRTQKSLKGIGSLALKMGGAFFAAKGIVRGLNTVINSGAKLQGVERGFAALGSKIGFTEKSFQKLQNATDGTVNKLKLMQEANNAMMLGVVKSDDEMAQLFDTAQRLGRALGVDTANAVTSLVTGMGRQSKLMLDNLGIIVKTEDAYKRYADELGINSANLTDQEKKIAFNNEVMRISKKMVEDLGEEQLTTADKLKKLSTSFFDMGLEIGESTDGFVNKALDGLQRLVDEAGKALDFSKSIDWKATMSSLVENADVIWTAWGNTARLAMDILPDALKGVIPALWDHFKNAVSVIVDMIVFVGKDLWKPIKNAFETLVFDLSAGWEAWKQTTGDIFELFSANVKNKFIGIARTIIGVINDVATASNKILGTTFDDIEPPDLIDTEGMAQKQEEAMNSLIEGQQAARKKMIAAQEESEIIDMLSSLFMGTDDQDDIDTMEEFSNALVDIWKTAGDQIIQINDDVTESTENRFNKTKTGSQEAGNTEFKVTEEVKKARSEGASQMVADLQMMSDANEKFKKIYKASAITLTIADTYQSASTQFLRFSQAFPAPFGQILGGIAATAAVGAGLARVQSIRKAQYGADFVTDGPQMMMVGEGSGPERVQVTPLSDPNIDGPQGQGIVLNIQGNVLHESFVEDNIIPQIREGLRLGENMGI